jgi:hypothetical protein
MYYHSKMSEVFKGSSFILNTFLGVTIALSSCADADFNRVSKKITHTIQIFIDSGNSSGDYHSSSVVFKA